MQILNLRRDRPATVAALLFGLTAVLLPAGIAAADGAGQDPAAMMAEIKGLERTLDQASAWLIGQRNADGSYGRNPATGEAQPSAGLTAMALHALASTHRNYSPADGPFISQPADWLLKNQQESGAIVAKDDKNANYETSVAIMALAQMVAAGDKQYQPAIDKAVGYLKGCQYAEAEGDAKSGGVGYRKGDTNVDLPNTGMFLAALKFAGHSKDSKEYKNALAYLERCQASAEVNQAEWAKTAKDGGGRYNEKGLTQNKAGVSTGALSYSLLTSYLILELPANDPRMVAINGYVAAHYSLDEHPGLGADGLYYYYAILGKALVLHSKATGNHTLKTADGVEHSWAQELGAKLKSLQQKDGSFVNAKSGKYWESDPVLCTSYAVLALSKARQDLLSQMPVRK